MRQTVLRPQLVEFIPEHLEDGVLYVSERYRTAAHRCCCGCGSEVVTPLGPAAWTLETVNGDVTLRPSIGNWSLPCRSHYFIRQGKVVWAFDMSREEIEQGRRRDQGIRDLQFAQENRRKQAPTKVQPNAAQHSELWLGRGWRAIRAWLGLAD